MLAASAKQDARTPSSSAADADDSVSAASFSPFMRTVQDKLLLGIEPSPDVAAILVVYFVQGAIGKNRLSDDGRGICVGATH